MSKQKYYQQIRAYADRHRIEMRIGTEKEWEEHRYHAFVDDLEYRIIPDSEGWIPFYAHEESDCPVDPEQIVEALISHNGETFKTTIPSLAGDLDWGNITDYPITRYRLVEEVDLYKDLKAAYKRGEVIQERVIDPVTNEWMNNEWMDTLGEIDWRLFDPKNLRIKPKTKKLYQWLLLNKQFPERPEYYLSDILYETEADIKRDLILTESSVVKRIDNSMIEVEM